MSDKSVADYRDEINRIRRVSDMLITGHASLRERYARRALLLDLAILAVSVWLTAVVFIDPRLNLRLTPPPFDPQVWIGVLGVLTFFLSIVQLRVDWKGRSDAHKRSFDLYAQVKNECRFLLSSGEILTRDNCQRVVTMFALSGDVGCQMPEKEFLRQKQKHLQKVLLSRYLDSNPSASLVLLKLRMWWASNVVHRKRQHFAQ